MTMQSLAMSSLRKVLRGLFGRLTARGWSFLAAGGAAVLGGLAIPEPDLVRVGALLVVLPVVSALIAGRPQYRLACTRRLDPPRVPAGQPATVTVRVGNVSRVRTGVLLAEDVTPDPLGGPGRSSCWMRSNPAGTGSCPTRSGLRPGQVRHGSAADPGRGHVRAGRGEQVGRRHEHARGHAEDHPAAPGRRAGQLARQGRRRDADDLGVGEDDAAPRAYQDGDSLHRVHWKSTARYGQLMVRREERQWSDNASVFLDTRRCAHTGSGPASTFEFAVSAAASIAAHLSGEGVRPG